MRVDFLSGRELKNKTELLLSLEDLADVNDLFGQNSGAAHHR